MPLSEAHLREIAFEMGLTEAEWRQVQATFEAHLARGQGFLRYRNWDKAISELRQAAALRPFDEPSLEGLARAYAERWAERSQEPDRRQAIAHAERCLQANPRNDRSLRIITDLGDVPEEAPPPPVPASSPRKLGAVVGLAAAGLAACLLLVFLVLAPGASPDALPVEAAPAISEPASGERDLPVSFVGSKAAGDLRLLLQEARFREYAKSSSISFKGHLQAKGVEISELALRVELLDRSGKRIYESGFEVLARHQPPARSLDLIPVSFAQHIKGKKGLYPHSMRVSVRKLEWKPMQGVYPESPPKQVYAEGNAAGWALEAFERQSLFLENRKERYVYHQVSLLCRNADARPLERLEGRIHWFDAQGQPLHQASFTLFDRSQPALLPGQQRVFHLSESVRGVRQAESIAGYRLVFYEAE